MEREKQSDERKKASPLTKTISSPPMSGKSLHNSLEQQILEYPATIALLIPILFLSGCLNSGISFRTGDYHHNSAAQELNQSVGVNWNLGEPDLLLQFPHAYSLSAGRSDVFRSFVIPNVSATDLYVRALDFKLSNPELVHHAEFRLDKTDHSRQKDLEDSDPGFRGMDNTTAHFPDGHFVNWLPGQTANLSGDLVWRLPAGADLVVQLHMMPAAKEMLIDPKIGLYTTDSDSLLNPELIWLGSRWLPITAGISDFSIEDSIKLPIAVEVLKLLPHCHYICETVNVTTTLPDESQTQLMRIENWDINEQKEFHFHNPLFLPAGTIISVEFRYNNSKSNSQNPNSPPQDVEFGPLSSNEMADLWIQVNPIREDKDAILSHSSALHLQNKIIEGQKKLLEIEPTVVGHFELAQSYRNTNKNSDAAAQLKLALKLEPKNLTVLESLAITLTELGLLDEALTHWKRYIQIAPNDAQAHVNISIVLVLLNQIVEAESHLKNATKLDGSSAPTFHRLGRVQAYLGKFEQALESYRNALRLTPNEPAVLQATSRLLATHPDPKKRNSSEALKLAEHAIQQFIHPEPMSLSTLAMAQASSGDFDLAITTAKFAMRQITPDHEKLLGPIILRQINLYKQDQIEVARAAGEKHFVAPGERRRNYLIESIQEIPN